MIKNISFIIPAYNCENTIKDAILSIVHGNLLNKDQIIVVDDFSSDATFSILKRLQKKYPQIKTFQNSWNKGSSDTRNTAIEKAKHEHIFCLDADNILIKGSVRKLLQYMNEMKADCASFQYLYYFRDTTNAVTHKWKFKEGIITLADYLTGYIVPGTSGNYLFTKESWIRTGGYPQCRTLDTWGFGLRQLATGMKMVVMPNTFYYHRYGHDSNWTREYKKGKNSLIALQIILPYINLIDKNDVNHIMSEKYRYSWFDDLLKKPLKLSNGMQGEGGEIVDKNFQDAQKVNLKSFLLKIGKQLKLHQ